MARYDVDVRIKPGQHVRRKVRAKSGHAAYERVVREHVERGGEWSLELAIVTRKGLRRRSTVLTGAPPGATATTAVWPAYASRAARSRRRRACGGPGSA